MSAIEVLPFDQLFVDVGLPETQVKRLVRVGDLISIRRAAFELKGGLFCGKALDDRASVAAVAVCLETLAASQHKWDVLGVASVQEETTFLGAATSAHGLQPDVAIAIDVTFGEQNGVSDDAHGGHGQRPGHRHRPQFSPGACQGAGGHGEQAGNALPDGADAGRFRHGRLAHSGGA